MKIRAYAKINLNLVIFDKREDGKHDLKSVFHKIDLFDNLEIKKNQINMCLIKCNDKELEKDNIIYKAYELLKEKYPFISGVNVYLEKQIPMQAGLGGGSSDCAAFIIGINELFKLNMNIENYKEIGSLLGADVVPCYYNVPVKAEGIGDKVEVINSKLSFPILIVKPEYSCNTKEMYQELDKIKRNRKDTTERIIDALEKNDIKLLSNNLYNSFEDVMNNNYFDIKKDILNSGALNAMLSGSGSCIFGIYENNNDLDIAYEKLKNKYEVYKCKSINKRGLIF